MTFFTLLAGARAMPGVILLPLGNGFQWSWATVLGAAVANRWFTERRGLVMGLFDLVGTTASGY